jgi:GxxExxY protein
LNHEGHEGHEGKPGWALGQQVIGCAMRVHSELGPGLLESAHVACLAYELQIARIPFEREKPLPIRYRDLALDAGFRIDLLVARELIVEVKAVETTLPVHEAQLLTYLKLAGIRAGPLINFNVRSLRDGLKRTVL